MQQQEIAVDLSILLYGAAKSRIRRTWRALNGIDTISHDVEDKLRWHGHRRTSWRFHTVDDIRAGGIPITEQRLHVAKQLIIKRLEGGAGGSRCTGISDCTKIATHVAKIDERHLGCALLLAGHRGLRDLGLLGRRGWGRLQTIVWR